jgi:osmoprotectant transport system substrate-binding protein
VRDTPRAEEGAVRIRPAVPAVVVALLLALLSACTGTSGDPAPESGASAEVLHLVSYDFREHQVLVEVYAEAARRAGVPVEVQHDAGTREILAPALSQGLVDVLVDYLGTSLAFARPDTTPENRTPAELHAALASVMGPRGVTVLRPSGAEDKNGFAVTEAFRREQDVATLSDLAPMAAELRFGGPPECPERRFCLPGLERVYGLEFGEVFAMPSRAATADALVSGQIDVGLLETTDARVAGSGLVLLADDRGLQPHENVVPLVRTEALERWGDRLSTAFDDVSARLTTGDVVRLNRAVELQGFSVREAAVLWWDDA